MWVLPTHKRPEKLARLILGMSETDKAERIHLVIWKDDPRLNDYRQVKMPHSWIVHVVEERLCGPKLNAMFQRYPTEPFYGFLSDDIQFATAGMLQVLRRTAFDGYFAWPDDGVHGIRMATHPVCPGKMLRALGFWAHPTFPHWGFDKVLYKVAEGLNIQRYCEDVKFHVDREPDETYLEMTDENDKAIDAMVDFERNGLQQLIESTRRAYGQED